jgi:carboxyl-terminal processing protease
MDQPPISNQSVIIKDKCAKNCGVKIFWIVLLVIFSFYLGIAWGKKNSQASDAALPSASVSNFIKNLSDPRELISNTDTAKPGNVDFDIFWKAWAELDKKYVDTDKLDAQERVYGAVKGMVAALGDPYSGFMDPEETKDFNTEIQGSFEGIGAELGMKDNVLTVIAPIEGTPAQKAGIQAGDKIFKIDGVLTTDMTVEDAVKKIRGPKGTEVTLTIIRKEQTETQDIAIKRDKIEIKSVIYEKKDADIAYIRINKFAEDTTRELESAITKSVADNNKGVVVDVRNNPGGLLDVSIDIASKFIPKGETVVIERGRDSKEKVFKAGGGDVLSDLPVVVLINEGSASASEILAGALRDNRQALLIGKKSFGKGSVQQLEKLSDGSSLRITIAKWFTPSGQTIHDVGLSPDIEVDISEEDVKNEKDTQLERALEELRNKMK